MLCLWLSAFVAAQSVSAQTEAERAARVVDRLDRDGSGAAQVPDDTPSYGSSTHIGTWHLTARGALFAQFLAEDGPRGGRQFSATNWIMGTAQRPIARGQLRVRGMVSIEPWTIGGCGYPNVLGSGELCADEPIADLQHPHELVMEAAAHYERPLTGALVWQLYAGLAGEPALGPGAYPHRLSALSNPAAPIFHHWLDSTHVAFGVASAGVSSRAWTVEGSIFNGREPDERRYDLDLGSLDSWSGRVWWRPTPRVTAQVSAAHLEDAEAQSLHDGGARFDVDRTTASATYHRWQPGRGIWATTGAWGTNAEAVGRTHAFMLESSLTSGAGNSWFARYEIGSKPGYDLAVFPPGPCATGHCPPPASFAASRATCCTPADTPDKDIYTVSKLQLGYVRYVGAAGSLAPGIGVSVSASRVPPALESFYGRRTTLGVGVFFTVRSRFHGPTIRHEH